MQRVGRVARTGAERKEKNVRCGESAVAVARRIGGCARKLCETYKINRRVLIKGRRKSIQHKKTLKI